MVKVNIFRITIFSVPVTQSHVIKTNVHEVARQLQPVAAETTVNRKVCAPCSRDVLLNYHDPAASSVGLTRNVCHVVFLHTKAVLFEKSGGRRFLRRAEGRRGGA